MRDRDDLAALGFHVCAADLEDELICALGAQVVAEVVAGQGELGSLRLFQNQLVQRGRTIQEQLRRFMGTRSMRRIRYAGLLVYALDLDRVPGPLDGLLTQI